jgi:DNA-directed RNA polymerase specialized sigma24 family protein
MSSNLGPWSCDTDPRDISDGPLPTPIRLPEGTRSVAADATPASGAPLQPSSACHPRWGSAATWWMMSSVDVEAEYSRNLHDLVRFATALVGPDDALDVVSEAVTSTLAGHKLSEVMDVRAYWFRAVANRSASWHRSGSRRRHRERASVTLATPVEAASADRARDLLSVLSAQQRVVVYLTYWHDWDPATISSVSVTERSASSWRGHENAFGR